jgi:rSAM/selenodomain-associated transferase 1
MHNKDCLILFIRFPEKENTKSRLQKSLDSEFVLTLYKCFVLDILNTIKKTSLPLKIFFTPAHNLSKVKEWLGPSYPYIPQEGLELGERMKNAFLQTFSYGYSKAILIGSDIPNISEHTIKDAFKLKAFDAVIGPSFDGGYYLIGFKKDKFLPNIFEDIEWGKNNVYQKTIEKLMMNKYKFKILQKYRDIDTIEDLKALFLENKHTEFSNSNTMKLLLSNEMRFL